MRTATEFLLTWLGGSAVLILLVSLSVECKWKQDYKYFLVALGVLCIGAGLTRESWINERKRILLDEQIWKSKGCPVYRTECGGKHRYSCERKAVVIGRNQVGDMFVEAYGICK